MFELIEEILLSQYLIFGLLMIMLLLVTRWALDTKEYAAYALGWLAGLLIIIIVGSLGLADNSSTDSGVTSGDAQTAFDEVEVDQDDPEDEQPTAVVLIPAFIGVFAGYGVMYFMEIFGGNGGRRSITISGTTVLLLLALYLVLGLSDTATRWIGVFALAFAVGSLFNIVLDNTSIPTRQPPHEAVQQAQSRPLGPSDLDARSGPSPSPFGEAKNDRFDPRGRR